MSQVQIPRYHLADQTEVFDVSLHLFSDASEDGYGMCSYLRFVHASSSLGIEIGLTGELLDLPTRNEHLIAPLA